MTRTHVTCVGCGAAVPDHDGPAHPYLLAAPGCWALFGGLGITLMALPGSTPARADVDCYAVQHPGGAEHDRRQRASVAIHLTTLCLLLERGLPPGRAMSLRGALTTTVLPAAGLADWPYLEPPARRGEVTAASVAAALAAAPGDRDVARNAVRDWSGSCWAAWSAHHEVVRGWAARAFGG